jgi:hypothetical protein
VYLYRRDASSGAWLDPRYLKASNADAEDHFGTDVAINFDGTLIVVGAIHEDSGSVGVDGDPSSNSVRDAGAVYCFHEGL